MVLVSTLLSSKIIGGKAVPVDEVLVGSLIDDVDGDGHSLAEAEQGPGNLAVVGEGADVDTRGDLDSAGLDGESMRSRGEGGLAADFARLQRHSSLPPVSTHNVPVDK
jgi:hypothetical protein